MRQQEFDRPGWVDYDSPAQPVPANWAAGGQVIVRGRYVVMGWSLTNATTNAAVETLYDGESQTALTVATIPIPANSTVNQFLGIPGIGFDIGVFHASTGAAVSGTLYVLPASRIGRGRREEWETIDIGTDPSGTGDAQLRRHHSGEHRR